MKLTVLGCSGSMPGPDSPAASYLLEQDGVRIVLDLGNGAFGALQRYVAPNQVDALVISHLHADHCLDVTSYFVALRYGPDGAPARIPLIGPAGTCERLEAAYDPSADSVGLRELFDFRTPAPVEFGPFALDFIRMNHPVETYATRVRAGGRTLVYSADTGQSAALVDLARDTDVLLCEATMRPQDSFIPDLHLTGREAGEHAAQAGVGRLIITHVPPWASREVAVAEAADAFDGPVEAALPDGVVEI